MASETCPRCGADSDAPANARWTVCSACGHLWKPGGSESAMPAASPAAASPVASSRRPPPPDAVISGRAQEDAPASDAMSAPAPDRAPPTPAPAAITGTPPRRRRPPPDAVISAGRTQPPAEPVAPAESVAPDEAADQDHALPPPITPVPRPRAPAPDMVIRTEGVGESSTPPPSTAPDDGASANGRPGGHGAEAQPLAQDDDGVRAIAPAIGDQLGSNEYRPIPDSGSDEHDAGALTVRREMTTPPSPLPASPPPSQRPAASSPAVAPASGPPPPVVPAPPTSGATRVQRSEVDIDLFDKIEKEIEYQRSEHRTVADPEFQQAVAVNGAPAGPTINCPVCGSRFPAPTTARQVACPQCDTVIEVRTGNIAGGVDDGDLAEEQTGDFDHLIGSTIAGCHIDRKLGEGGMGSVYHARQLSLDRSVAIKVLPPEFKRNKKFIRRFEQEAKSLARINHPNIMHIYDFGEDAGSGAYFMVMEFVDGEDLAEVLRKRHHLPVGEVLEVMRQSAQGLAMAAEKQVVHRDIKPDNLMITKEGVVKVSDFGLAKDITAATEVTNAGMRVGTPAFMSPEQCDGKPLDFRSDIYSLGCTAYVSMTGRLPFDGDSPFAIMLKHKSEPYPGLDRYLDNIDPRIDRLLARMMAKERDERFESLDELVQHISTVMADSEDVATTASQAQRALRFESSGELPPLPFDMDGVPRMSAPGGDGQGAGRDHRSSDLGIAPAPGAEADVGPGADRSNSSDDDEPMRISEMIPSSVKRDRAGSSSASSVAPAPPLSPEPSAPSATPRPEAKEIDPQLRANPSSRRRVVAGKRRASGEVRSPATHDSNFGSGTDRLLDRADRALQQGDYRAAVEQYQAVVQRHPSDRRVHERLADARARARQQEVGSIEEEGDRLAQAGRLKQAIDAWQRAAQMSSQWRHRETILQKVDRTRGRLARRRHRRVILALILVLALIGVSIWTGVPMAHRYLADREWHRISTIGDPVAQERAIETMLASYGDIPVWYRRVFRWPLYTVPAVVAAEARLDQLRTDERLRRDHRTLGAEIEALRALRGDDSVSWRKVLDRARALRTRLGDDHPDLAPTVEAIQAEAQGMVQGFEHRRRAIDDLLAEGRIATALAQADALRRMPRLGDMAEQLPVSLAVEVVDPQKAPLANAILKVDGVTVSEGATAYRIPARPVQLEVHVPGFVSHRQTVAAGTDDPAVVQVVMMPGRAWKQAVAANLGTAPWCRVYHVGDNRLLAHGPNGLLLVGAADGTVHGGARRNDYQPPPPSGDQAQWTRLFQDDGTAVSVGADDGAVLRLGLEPQAAQRLPLLALRARYRSAIVGFLEFAMAFRADATAQVALLRSGAGYRLLCRHLPHEDPAWAIDDLAPGPVPFVFHRREKVFVIDRDGARFYDEESGRTKPGILFEAHRSAPPRWFADGDLLAVPCDEHLEILSFPISEEVKRIQRLDLPALVQGPAEPIAGLLVVGLRNGTVVALAQSDGLLHERWRRVLDDSRIPAGVSADCAGAIAIADTLGRITIFAAADGRTLRTYEHPVPVLALHGITDRLVVYDQQQRLSAYQLPP